MSEELAIDYQAAIEYCYKKLGHAQGTGGCIAFAKGAEWMRNQVELNRRAQTAGSHSLAIKALRYYRDECSGAEPSISAFHRMLDEALDAQPEPVTSTQQAAIAMADAFGRGHDAGWAAHELHASLKKADAAPSVAPEPVGMRPYNPTEAMRWAAKRVDPALPQEHIRSLWCAMWSAYTHPPRAPLTKNILLVHRPCYSESEWPVFVGGVRFAEMAHGISAEKGAAK